MTVVRYLISMPVSLVCFSNILVSFEEGTPLVYNRGVCMIHLYIDLDIESVPAEANSLYGAVPVVAGLILA